MEFPFGQCNDGDEGDVEIRERFEFDTGERGVEPLERHGDDVVAGDDFARRLSVYQPVS